MGSSAEQRADANGLLIDMPVSVHTVIFFFCFFCEEIASALSFSCYLMMVGVSKSYLSAR